MVLPLSGENEAKTPHLLILLQIVFMVKKEKEETFQPLTIQYELL